MSFSGPLQLLEAAWCLTNIAAGKPEETLALLPAIPLLIAHLGGFSLYILSFLLNKTSKLLLRSLFIDDYLTGGLTLHIVYLL